MLEDRFEKECLRLRVPPARATKPGGLGAVEFLIKCPGNASQVLSRAKSLLVLFCERSESNWPSLAEWQNILPQWFLDRCAPDMTRDQAEKWLVWWESLPLKERARANEDETWSLDGWLHWMEPTNRSWAWWDGCELDANTLAVAIEVVEWPFPWGSFRWLLVAAGAETVAEV